MVSLFEITQVLKAAENIPNRKKCENTVWMLTAELSLKILAESQKLMCVALLKSNRFSSVQNQRYITLTNAIHKHNKIWKGAWKKKA